MDIWKTRGVDDAEAPWGTDLMNKFTLAGAALAASLAFSLSAGAAHAGIVHGLTDDGRIVTFDDATPGTLDKDEAVTGLFQDETLIALEVHPCDGRLFAISDQDRLYEVDPDTGAATPVVTLGSALGETAIGAAIHPDSLVLRVVGESDANNSIDIETGAVTPETALQYADPDGALDPVVSGLAFFDGGLLAIDTERDELVSLDPAADGTLTRIGRLGVDAAAPVGLDHRSGDAALLASINVGGLSGLYAINPETGHIAFLGTIGDGTTIVDVAATAAAPEGLSMDKLDLKFDFKKSGKDQAHIRGKLPAPEGDYAGLVVTVDIGGAMRTFTLDSKGKAKNGNDTFMFEGKPKDGLVKYDTKFKKADLSDDLADEGMDGSEEAKKEDRDVIVVITVGDTAYAGEATVEYTAKVGKTGNAKLDKSTPIGGVGFLPDAECEGVDPPTGDGFTIDVRGNSNTVTVQVGETDAESPFIVTSTDQDITINVASGTQIHVILRGGSNTVVLPTEFFETHTSDIGGNRNEVVEQE
jgi:hypothetical protein